MFCFDRMWLDIRCQLVGLFFSLQGYGGKCLCCCKKKTNFLSYIAVRGKIALLASALMLSVSTFLAREKNEETTSMMVQKG